MTHPQLEQALLQPQGIITYSKPVKWSVWTPNHTSTFGAPTIPKRIVLEWTPDAFATECFTERQAFTKVWSGKGLIPMQHGAPEGAQETRGPTRPSVLEQRAMELWGIQYGQLLIQTPTYDLHVLRKGDRVTIKERPASRHSWPSPSEPSAATPSSRALDATADAELLRRIDLLTPEGTIRASMADKFRQLNHLLNIIDTLDVVHDLKTGSVLHVVDAGCGKAYLSFALTHVLKKRGIHVHLLGVDTNQHVIEHNRTVAAELGFEKARFEVSTIANTYSGADTSNGTEALRCDLLIALHACDTATDEALALGIRTNALAMLVAPCCHHFVQKQMRAGTKGVKPEMSSLLEDGIIRERIGDLLTDTMRRDIVRSYGYDAHLEEFIALEHTMKNILLKATKKNKKATVPAGLPPSVALLMQTWNVQPYLPTLLAS